MTHITPLIQAWSPSPPFLSPKPLQLISTSELALFAHFTIHFSSITPVLSWFITCNLLLFNYIRSYKWSMTNLFSWFFSFALNHLFWVLSQKCPINQVSKSFLLQNTVFSIFLFLLLPFKSLLYMRLSIFTSCSSIRLESPFWHFVLSFLLLISWPSPTLLTGNHDDIDISFI